MLLGTLGGSLLANILTGRGAIAKNVSEETKQKRQGRGIKRAGEIAIVKRQSRRDKVEEL